MAPPGLEELQRRVARRADELAREMGPPSLPLHCWLLAEHEILAPVFAEELSSVGRDAGKNVRSVSRHLSA